MLDPLNDADTFDDANVHADDVNDVAIGYPVYFGRNSVDVVYDCGDLGMWGIISSSRTPGEIGTEWSVTSPISLAWIYSGNCFTRSSNSGLVFIKVYLVMAKRRKKC